MVNEPSVLELSRLDCILNFWKPKLIQQDSEKHVTDENSVIIIIMMYVVGGVEGLELSVWLRKF